MVFSRFQDVQVVFQDPQYTDIMWWIYSFFTFFKNMFTTIDFQPNIDLRMTTQAYM